MNANYREKPNVVRTASTSSLIKSPSDSTGKDNKSDGVESTGSYEQSVGESL
jgi:hypothetical protein